MVGKSPGGFSNGWKKGGAEMGLRGEGAGGRLGGG